MREEEIQKLGPSGKLLGTQVDAVTFPDVIQRVSYWVNNKVPAGIIAANVHVVMEGVDHPLAGGDERFVRLARRLLGFSEALRSAKTLAKPSASSSVAGRIVNLTATRRRGRFAAGSGGDAGAGNNAACVRAIGFCGGSFLGRQQR